MSYVGGGNVPPNKISPVRNIRKVTIWKSDYSAKLTGASGTTMPASKQDGTNSRNVRRHYKSHLYQRDKIINCSQYPHHVHKSYSTQKLCASSKIVFNHTNQSIIN